MTRTAIITTSSCPCAAQHKPAGSQVASRSFERWQSVTGDSVADGTAVTPACRCAEIISGAGKAETAEELLRARYTAFVLGHMRFVTATTHPSSRSEEVDQANRRWSEESTWQGLQVIDSRCEGEDVTFVTFEAKFTRRGEPQTHRERSRFERVDGEWFFVSCEIVKNPTVRYTQPKPGRNALCFCGSGKKYKRCCA